MLEDLRKNLDDIDDKIAVLYNDRMKIVKKIGLEKAKTGGALYNKTREKEIINRIKNIVDLSVFQYAKQVFENIFETSRAYQKNFLSSKSKTVSDIKQVLLNGELNFPKNATVACQGIDGSYSTIATEKVFNNSEILYCKTFEGVFTAVEQGLCKYGLLPIENSTVGSVNAIYDLMKKHKFYIVRSLKLKVNHNLLMKKNSDFSSIKEIFSHEQAIEQCKSYLTNLKDVKITICSNTAMGAKIVADSDRNDIACISSKECADIYNLKIHDYDIQDSDTNYTRFICISKNLEIFKNSNRISLMVVLPHKPGSLNSVLNKFSTLNLNLTKIESRPLGNHPFEFMFYFDFESDSLNNSTLMLLDEIESLCDQFVFLGNYYEEI